MASNDVRDVLNLPSDDLTPRPSKKQKTAAPRHNLKGLAREVQNLGGDNPIAIVPEVSLYKKRRFANRKPAAKWELKQFKNSARSDQSLILRHWKRKTEPGQPGESADGESTEEANKENAEEGSRTEETAEDSAFAKFNVKVQIPEYNDEQYNAKLQSDDWTKEETTYLMELVRDYDLRWPVIWDRYDFSPTPPEGTDTNGSNSAVVPAVKPRDMEDLKARYYEVAAKMMELQKAIQYMTQPEWDLHQTMVNFKPEQERERKKFALNSMSRSKEEAKEEESLLIEVKRIMARQERFNEERKELYQRLEYPHSDQDINAFKGSAGLTNLLGTLQNMSQAKKRKPITGPEGTSPAVPAPPNGQPASATSEAPPSRRESTAAPSAGVRESIGAEKPTPAGNKKGQPPPERRKLNEQEEQIYGVSTHERLGSGPTFRYERVNKIFSHKSGQQQQRIQNVLTELDIPVRLNMPTAPVVAEYEKLVLAVTGLVDLRKMRDKLDGEIKIEEAKKAERAKARVVLGLDGANEDPNQDKKADEGPAETKAEAATEEKPPKTNGEPASTAAEAGADAQQTADAPTANGDGAAAAGDEASTPVVKEEEGGRPGSSGGGASGNKRSASVLSTTSDKSAKRQRK